MHYAYFSDKVFPGAVNLPLLQEQAAAAFPGSYLSCDDGVTSSDTRGLGIYLSREITPEDEATWDSLILAHDGTQQTVEQAVTAAETQLRTVDYSDLLAMAETGLTQIAADKSDVQAGTTAASADKSSLTGSPTQAQVLAVVRRMVDRELVLYAGLDHILTRQDKIIRVLRHVVKP